MNRTNIGVAYSQRRSAIASTPLDGDRDDAVKKTPIEAPTPPSAEVFTVKVACNGDMGRVSGNGLSDGVLTARNGDSVTLTATPKTGYRFVKWSGVPATTKNTNPTVTFNVTSNLSVAAEFAKETAGTAYPVGGGGGGGTVVDPANPSVTGSTGLKALLKKYWWVLAILLGYWLYKEGKL